jgi:hypothetical protein
MKVLRTRYPLIDLGVTEIVKGKEEIEILMQQLGLQD